jgi:uncharacterized protein
MKKFVALLFSALFLCTGCGLMQSGEGGKENVKTPSVVFETSKGKTPLTIEIADTSEERAKGLMNRKNLPEGNGMLFIFEGEKQVIFWMKNTLIPLDMIFLDAKYNVVHIQKDARPCVKDPCETFPSGKPAKYVIEVNSGTSDKIGLKEGDKVQVNI